MDVAVGCPRRVGSGEGRPIWLPPNSRGKSFMLCVGECGTVVACAGLCSPVLASAPWRPSHAGASNAAHSVIPNIPSGVCWPHI